MNRYERITFTEKPTKTAKTLILRITRETDVLLIGVEVDKMGDEVQRAAADETLHIISKDMLAKRVELVMNNTYGWLEVKKETK
jgi:hypothetical protein